MFYLLETALEEGLKKLGMNGIPEGFTKVGDIQSEAFNIDSKILEEINKSDS